MPSYKNGTRVLRVPGVEVARLEARRGDVSREELRRSRVPALKFRRIN